MRNIKQYLKEVSDLIGAARSRLPLLLVLFLAASCLDILGIGLIAPYISLILDNYNTMPLVKSIADSMGADSSSDTFITWFGVLLLLVFLIRAVMAIFIHRVILNFALGLSRDLRTTLMTGYLALPYERHASRNSSEYVYNVTLADQFAISTVQALLRLASESLVTLMAVALLAFYDLLALSVLVGLLGTLIILYDRIFRPHLGRLGAQANIHSAKVVQSINEGLGTLKELRILGREQYFVDALHRHASEYSKAIVTSSVIGTAPRYLLETVMVGFVVLLFVLVSATGMSRMELLPLLGTFGVAAIRLAPAANQIIGSITRLRIGRHGVGLLHSDLQEMKINREQFAGDDAKIITPFKSIAFRKVDFRYENSAGVGLHDLSFSIAAGEAIGIVGPSGAGKTTLVDLILGLLTKSDGEILINGQVATEAHFVKWRSQVAYLPQEVFMLDDTLRKNIAFGVVDEDIDETKLKSVVNMARLAPLVQSLQHGVDTKIGERGIRLSGGQRQRIALARALYHDRSVLVLDEATSALDRETEKVIVSEIAQLKPRVTLVVIAHRLSTLENCDRIIRLEGGRVAEIGNVEAVLSATN